MQEQTEIPLAPAITTNSRETKYPYQEQKERHRSEKFDTIIVFGQGPVKPVLLPEELTAQQKQQWQDFKKDPLHNKEPDFRVIEGSVFLSLIDEIKKRADLTEEEKQQLIESKRQEWQRMGRLALNRWGRENALAAGLALYLGITDKLILSGGKTKPGWVEQTLPKERLDNWPSEAQLMRDIIVRRFGQLYQERYGKPIEEAIQFEDASTNTLLNFANSINKNPSLISSEGETGFLATDFHIRRCLFLAKLFSMIEAPPENLAAEAQRLLAELDQIFNVQGPIIKAQTILGERAKIRGKQTYQEIQEWLLNLEENIDLQERVKGEKRWTRGLTDPSFLEYFACYFGQFNNPETLKPLQNFLGLLRQPGWFQKAGEVFKRMGLNLDEFKPEDLPQLLKEDPEKFQQLTEGLKNIKRVAPPEET